MESLMKKQKTIKVDESELDMFAKYGVKTIQKGKTEIKIVKTKINSK